jgi:hypothetical protein
LGARYDECVVAGEKTMKALSRAAILCLCLMLLTACAYTKRFQPTTVDERAIASTLESFLTAFRTRDFATIDTLITPEATLTMDETVSRELRTDIVALRAEGTDSALLQVTPKTLVNFQRPSPDTASVQSYVHTVVDGNIENSQLTWELTRRGDEWLILALAERSWRVILHTPGGGP